MRGSFSSTLLDASVTLMFMTQQTVPLALLGLVLLWWFHLNQAPLGFFVFLSASIMTLIAPNPSAVKHTPLVPSLVTAAAVFACYTYIASLSDAYVVPMAIVSSLWDMSWLITREQITLKTAAVWSLRLLEWYYISDNEGRWVQITFIVPLAWCFVLYTYKAIFNG